MSIKIKKILVPYNATPSSENALKKLFPLIEPHNSKIILLTCLRDQATFGFFKTKSDKNRIIQEKKRAQKYHDHIKKAAEKFGLTITSIIIKSDLESESILDCAKKEGVDLIVMSKTKLSTDAEKLYYRSTVDAVFKKTNCAFLYIP